MSAGSAFDIENFMDQGTDEMGDTRFKSTPSGKYPAIIDDVKVRSGESKKTGQPWIGIEIFWNCNLDAAAQKVTGRERSTVRQSFLLDVDKQGKLDMSAGKNIRLNQVREAVGAVKGFKFGKLKGAGPAMVNVTERPDPNDPDTIYNDVRSVEKM